MEAGLEKGRERGELNFREFSQAVSGGKSILNRLHSMRKEQVQKFMVCLLNSLYGMPEAES